MGFFRGLWSTIRQEEATNVRGVGGSSKQLGYEWGRNIPLLQCMIFLISSLHSNWWIFLGRGDQFTWSNNLEGPSMSLLDWFLYSAVWEDQFPTVTQGKPYPRLLSDHFFVLLECGKFRRTCGLKQMVLGRRWEGGGSPTSFMVVQFLFFDKYNQDKFHGSPISS